MYNMYKEEDALSKLAAASTSLLLTSEKVSSIVNGHCTRALRAVPRGPAMNMCTGLPLSQCM